MTTLLSSKSVSALSASSPASSASHASVRTAGAQGRGVALVLAGCGAKDGTEITEAVSLLVALSQAGFQTSVFAPARAQTQVVNHLTGQEVVKESRDILEESARIARGKVAPLARLAGRGHEPFAAVVVAGGFGTVKNLCDFAFAGVEATLKPDVREALLPFLEARKPLAALCIAPVILALAARDGGVTGARLTLGDGSAEAAVRAIEAWGAVHVPCAPGKAVVDADGRFVSAPAYMYDDASPADVFASATALVDGLGTLLA